MTPLFVTFIPVMIMRPNIRMDNSARQVINVLMIVI